MSVKLGKKKNGQPISLPNLPPLPEGWRWVALGDVAAPEENSITDGPFGSNLKTEHYTTSGPRVVRLQNIGEGIFRDAEAHISVEHFDRLRKHQVFAGDLVIAALGETLPRAAVVPEWLGPAIVKADCIRFKVDAELVLSPFLCFALNSEPLRKRTASIIHGVGRPRLNLKEIKSIHIPLASLPEQRRIVAKIEELFSDLDAGVAALERAKANLKRYRAAVLKAAVEGSLTAEWRALHPNVESASKLLQRILDERRQKWEADQLAKFAAAGKQPPKGWREKYVEPSPPDTSNLPELPEGWCWVTLGQLLHGIEGGKSFKCLTRQASDEEWGVIKVSAMTWGTFLEEENKAIPPGSQIDPSNEIKPDDLLLSRCNTTELVGATVLIGDCRQRLLLSDKSLRLLASDQLDRRWLHKALSSSMARSQLSAMATGTSDSMRNISQEKIESVVLPLPPATEQGIVVSVVEERLSITTTCERAVASDLLRAARLRQSILKQAFAGKLVPQDAAEESTTALLSRIAAQVKDENQVHPLPPTANRKNGKEVFLRRTAIVSYTVQRLANHRSFGRTQLEKSLHLMQSHLGIDLGLVFERYPAGPFDKSIYALEGVAKKRDWFTTQDRPNYGVTYHPGSNIEEQCRHAAGHLGERRQRLDALLDHIGRLNTDEAELFATAYAAWNDLLIDGRPATDSDIIAEIHGWHEKKKRFTPRVITARLKWMREHGYVPTGQGHRTRLVEKSSSNRRASRKGRKGQ